MIVWKEPVRRAGVPYGLGRSANTGDGGSLDHASSLKKKSTAVSSIFVLSSVFLTSRVWGVVRVCTERVHASRKEVETASRSKSVALQPAPGSPGDLALGE